MGFQVEPGIWTGAEGASEHPRPRSLPPRTQRPPLIDDAWITESLAPEIGVAAHRNDRPPKRLPPRLPCAISEPLPIWLGSVDDDWLPAWSINWVNGKPPLSRGWTDAPVSMQALTDLAYLNLPAADVDELAGLLVSDTHPYRLPLRGLVSFARDPQQFHDFVADPLLWVQQQPSKRLPAAVPGARQGPAYNNEIGETVEQIAWVCQSVRLPGRLPPAGQAGAASPAVQSPREDFEFWFPVYHRPRMVELPACIRLTATWEPGHVPWLSCFSILVAGPFYAVAGQVSPAAGAVMGDVRAAGED